MTPNQEARVFNSQAIPISQLDLELALSDPTHNFTEDQIRYVTQCLEVCDFYGPGGVATILDQVSELRDTVVEEEKARAVIAPDSSATPVTDPDREQAIADHAANTEPFGPEVVDVH